MATIHWTKELRAAATERTFEDLGPATPAARAWAVVKKSLKAQPNGFNAISNRFLMAHKHSNADLVPVIDRAIAFVTSETLPETAPDAEAAGYALATYWMMPGASSMFDAIASYGATLAHAAVLYAHGLKPTNVQNNYSILTFVPEPREGSIWARELRCAVLRASDEQRAACVAAAKERFENADFFLKVTLAVAHPSQPEWAVDVARAILANTSMRYPPLTQVFMSLRDFDLLAPLLARRSYSQGFLDLIDPFGDRILPILVEMLDNPKDRHELKHSALALSVFEGEEIASAFAKHLSKKQVREVAIPWFLRFPNVSVPALEEAASGKTKSARLAAQVLEQARRVRAIEAVPSEEMPADEATAEELPAILVNPPWVKAKRKRATVERVEVDLLARPETIDLPPDERTRLLAFINAATNPAMTDAEAEAWQAGLERGDTVGLWVHNGKLVPPERATAAFNEGRKNIGTNVDVDPWVAIGHVGLPAMPGVLRYLETRFGKSGNRYWMTAIHAVDSPRIAAALIPYIHGTHEHTVRKWMNEHLEAAIVALVRAAIGGDAQAAIKLRTLSSHRVRIQAIADEYGEAARKASDAILDRDPRLDCPPKPPTLPSTWRPETLHRPRLKSGKLLPLWALEPIAHMLKFSDLTPTYPGLLDVKDACEPRSLAEFSWSLAEGWDLGGAKKKDAWMLDSLAHLADDEVTRRTTPALKDNRILFVLAAIGTDAAAMELATIVARASSHYGAGAAETQLAEIAKRRGLSKDELEDRITPTLVDGGGLGPDGKATLDYGTRVLEVGFDTRLEPFVVWESGERQRQLPPKRKSDDQAMVKAAQEKWRDLKEDVATIADRRSRAVERSMLSGRSWSRDEFVAYWVNHPLLVHMAQGIVWCISESGTLTKSFRVAEDHTFAGCEDEAVEIPEGARVVVPHPIELGSESTEAWLRVFEDYRIVPPIDQLARAIHHLSEGEASATKIERPLAQPMTYHQLDAALGNVGFTDRTWGGNMRTAKMPLDRSKSFAVVEFPYNVAQLTSASIRFTNRTGEALTPGDVHPVELSEVVRAVLSLNLPGNGHGPATA